MLKSPSRSRLSLGLCAVLLGSTMLALAEDKAADPKSEEGFVSIFNGKDMTGWVGNTKGYYADGKGNMVCDPTKQGGNVYTEKEYSNFVFRFEFKLAPGTNNGLGIRAPLEGDAAYVGMEIQILDDEHENYKGKIAPWQRHGSIYGIAAAKPGHLKPAGEWNVEEVTADGRHITVKLNGETIVDVENLDTWKFESDHKPESHPGLKNEKGHIGFLGHGHPLEFRNLRIKELPAKPAKS